MAAVNSRVLACNYAISDTTSKFGVAATPSSVALPSVSAGSKSVRAQQQTRVPELKVKEEGRGSEGRRAALFGLAAFLFAASTSSAANASIIDEYLEKSKTNKALNDKKRLATSGANFARAYTVEFGSCKFPENFTGCQDLAKQKKVPFISDDLKLECEGKDKYKCGSNVFWKW